VAARGRIVFVLKGYPRLSETFIAQEILALERRGLDIAIVSLRRPTDPAVHPIHSEIRAPVLYLPEHLRDEPARVHRAWRALRATAGYVAARRAWLRDLARDPSRNRVRRFGQALALAHELPAEAVQLHAHFLHTPASVARYAALMAGLPWTCSAHAKDIWTTPRWEKAEKLAACRWLVTCTAVNRDHLAALAPPGRVALVYHGLDGARFPPPPTPRPTRDGRDADDPVTILSVGRAVPKKGYDDLIAALAALPPELHWRFVHIGGGPLLGALAKQAEAAGVGERIDWLGPQPQDVVLRHYRAADIFALAGRVTDDGDRDGLPNVLMEAASQRLAILATRVSAIPELIDDGVHGRLVAPRDRGALAEALAALIVDPEARARLGAAAEARVRADFALDRGIDRLAQLFGLDA